VIPRADLYQVDGELVAELDLAGVAPDDIELMVGVDSFTISGTRGLGPPGPGEDGVPAKVHRKERSDGPFRREIPLPLPVLREAAEATLRDGILTVRLVLKRDPPPPRRLCVQPSEDAVRDDEY
jgi:HSP20 family protein